MGTSPKASLDRQGQAASKVKVPNFGQDWDSRTPGMSPCVRKFFQVPPNSTFTMAIKGLQAAPLPICWNLLSQ